MPIFKIFLSRQYSGDFEFLNLTVLHRADCADFGCHNSIRLEMEHFLNTLALPFISFSGRFVFAMQKHYFCLCERSSSFNSFCYRFITYMFSLILLIVDSFMLNDII